jgi:uncharacterized protein (DUF1501 family)
MVRGPRQRALHHDPTSVPLLWTPDLVPLTFPAMCDHHAPEPQKRAVRLEDGAAHAEDHARWSRRDFLVRMGLGTVGATFLAGSTPIGVFGSAPALDLLAGLDTDRVLVLIQLSGGNDGLNTVVPLTNDVYRQRRATIGIQASAVTTAGTRLSDEWGLHPVMAPLVGPSTSLWARGDLAIAHAVGYRTQSRSHFEGIDNWFTGSGGVLGGTATPRFGDGWVGRYLLSEVPGGQQPSQFYAENPPAVSLGSSQRLFDSSAGNLAIGRLTDTATAQALRAQGVVYPLDTVPAEPYGASMRYLREQANTSLAYVVKFAEATDPNKTPNRVPLSSYGTSSFAQNLAMAARIVRGGLSPRIISVTLGGFDTHANQGPETGAHANLLTNLSNALKAFFDDLRVDGLDQRVVAMTFSEFGRTLGQNVSGGTDHGTASPVILAGPAVQGGFFGTAPNLVNDLTGTGSGAAPSATTDYRNLYATLLERWFNLTPAQVDTLLGASFARMNFLSPTATGAADDVLAAGAMLSAPSPNPFSARTSIRYRLAEPGPARLAVYDGQGRLVATLADGILPAGDGQATLDGAGLAAGLYVVRLETARGVVTKPVVRVR